MSTPRLAIEFPGESKSNAIRASLTQGEPIALRTFTPTQVVIARSAGVFHWTSDGRRLYDYTSGVLVSNLGHNPRRWLQRFARYLGWTEEALFGPPAAADEYVAAVPQTAYNAMTEIEGLAVSRLLKNMQGRPGGARMQSVMWAASGSEAVQKALWACLHRDESRDLILATRFGFHGKKGLSGAVTGSEADKDRDPRVIFIGFPREEIDDLSRAAGPIDLTPYRQELERLWVQHGPKINCLITEPYLGGGGSYHPPAAYLQLLQSWCREHDVVFVLDEVQANFGRTGKMYAYETYGLEPDIVCLGKGLGNGVAVSAAVGRADLMASLKYGDGSDTWSANPLASAAVVATLDEFEAEDVLGHAAKLNEIFTHALLALKSTGVIAKVRGEGMVFGLECAGVWGRSPNETAIEIVRTCYLGRSGGDGIHLLGPLAGKVLRISPPMTMTISEAHDSLKLFHELITQVAHASH
ncbi:MAG: aspartate aminotransferase family protein [Planctomycetota bacterium]|nr:MAG: aspartate aminotransferase family protein [Planctomycetota bacterium]